MGRIKEPLSGGLNNAQDPVDLQPGEQSDLRNAVHDPRLGYLVYPSGREVFGAVSANPADVVGLRDFKFDNADHYLVALASATLKTAPVGTTGTFTTLASLAAAGTQLEVIHYRNRFFLLSGVAAEASAIGSNVVAFLSATGVGSTPLTRQHGMLAVAAGPTVATAAGTFSQSVTGYYEYWTTEVAKITADGAEFFMESTFTGRPTTVFVSATGMVPQIQMPSIQNGISTHWRIYRSPKKDLEADTKFPVGFMIAETSTATAVVGDTLTVTATSYVFPGSFNSGGNQYADWANASNLGAAGGGFASATAATAAAGFGLNVPVTRSHGVYGFNFGGFIGTVKGIEVEVAGYVASGSAPVALQVRIGRQRRSNGSFVPPSTQVNGITINYNGQQILESNTAAKSGLITSTSSGALTTLTFGSSTDRWFAPNHPRPLVDTDFGTDFMAVVSYAAYTPHVLALDYIKIKVHYAATFDSIVAFPTVAYTFGDITAQVGKNGPPPSSDTGDVYEDTLVVNDVSNPAVVRYSYPGDPEAFPPTYYVDFETRDNDRIRCIKVVNNRLIVGLDTSVWRMNYLPSERDASFDRGKAIEPLSRKFGIVNPMCAATFTRDGGNEEVAFVSFKGIHSTDGFTFNTRSGKVDWRQIISLTSTSTPICLIDNPEEERLEFYFRNEAYTPESYLKLCLSYAKGDVDEAGNFKCSGLVHMRNYVATVDATIKSAWSVPRSNGDTSVYLGYGGAETTAGAGKVYLETGTTLPAQDATMQYTSRRMFLAGEGNEFKLNEVYGYGVYSGAPIIRRTLKNIKTNDSNAEVTGQVKSRTLAGEKLYKHQFFQMCEGVRISTQVTATAGGEDFLLLDGDGFGLEDSGR